MKLLDTLSFFFIIVKVLFYFILQWIITSVEKSCWFFVVTVFDHITECFYFCYSFLWIYFSVFLLALQCQWSHCPQILIASLTPFLVFFPFSFLIVQDLCHIKILRAHLCRVSSNNSNVCSTCMWSKISFGI